LLTEFHIGIDDTDSENGGCTTYTAAVLFEELVREGFSPTDFPWLVRLNPNIPWKTRGNGSLSLHFQIEEKRVAEAKKLAIGTVIRTSDLSAASTDPAVAFLEGTIPEKLKEFSNTALHDVIRAKDARILANALGVELHLVQGARGVVGALAAIGARLDSCLHTFEVIAYRTATRLGKPREIEKDSVLEMDKKYRDKTFHNVDLETGRVLIGPHGPDPVLLGIRGYDPWTILMALREIRVHEPIERTMIFRTNHGTNAHLTRNRSIEELEAFQSAVLTGRVDAMPVVLRGGHVIFRLADETGTIDCAVYEPTGSLTKTSRELLPGDRLRVYGGVHPRKRIGLSLNVEALEVLDLTPRYEVENPFCVSCGGRLESMGRGQGLRCKKCGLRSYEASKRRTQLERKLMVATYIPSVRARRHLARPISPDDEQRL